MAKPASKPSRAAHAVPYDVDTFVGKDGIGALITHNKTHLWEAADLALAPFKITLSQWIVLENVFRGDVGMTPADICEAIGYDRGAMTRLIDRLEEKGFLRRAPHPEDRRSVTLELTPAGRALHPKLLKVIVAEMNSYLEGFSVEEARLLESMLRRVMTNTRARVAKLRKAEA